MRRGFVVGVLLVGAVSSVLAQDKTDPKLNELTSAFVAAFNQKDAVKITAFYTDDAVIMAPDMPAVKGRGNIETYYRNGFARTSGTMRLTPSESSATGGIAFETGASAMTNGSPPRTSTGKYVVIYRRVGNDWKIAYDIFNND